MSSSSARKSAGTHARDGYEPLDLIGKGSFGKIRRVRRKSDGRIFARKELEYEKMGEQDKRQLVAEVNILRMMDHANIVKYEDRFVDVEDRILYIIMEYCDGGDLGGLIKKCRKTGTLLPEETVWSYLAQMTSGLHACHNRSIPSEPEAAGGLSSAASMSNLALPAASGMPSRRGSLLPSASSSNLTGGSGSATSKTTILHRDLKPENVFLHGDQRIKLGDFGLSKELQPHHDFAATYVGTPYYMSPELSEGKKYDTKSDIWALGCIAHELCALSPPFDAKTQEELTRKIRIGKVPRLPSAYSESLAQIITAMLSLDPRHRPATSDLLAHPMIDVQLRSLELLDMRALVVAEKARLEAWDAELQAREERVQALEAALASMAQTDAPSSSAPPTVLEEEIAALTARAEHLSTREQAASAYETELQSRAREFEAAQAHFEVQKKQAEDQLNQRAAELEAAAQQQQQRRRAGMSNVGSSSVTLGERAERPARQVTHRRSRVLTAEDVQEAEAAAAAVLRSSASARRRRSRVETSSSASSAESGGRASTRGSAPLRASTTSADRERGDSIVPAPSGSRFARVSSPTDQALQQKQDSEDAQRWEDVEDQSDVGEPAFAATAPVESTPLRHSTAKSIVRPSFRTVAAATARPSLFRDPSADDSDLPMNSVEHSRAVAAAEKEPSPGAAGGSDIPSAKSFPSLASGRHLAHLAALNAAGLGRPPLVSRHSGANNLSLQDVSMKSASGEEDRSLKAAHAPPQAATPSYSDDSLPSVFIDKVVRSSTTSLTKRPSEGKLRPSMPARAATIDVPPVPAVVKQARPSAIGRPRASAATQPIMSATARRKSTVRLGA